MKKYPISSEEIPISYTEMPISSEEIIFPIFLCFRFC
nr:MAG TPA: hypothetical protein [Caudoviricetes sp.]